MLHCISMKNRNESLQVKDILFLMESVGCDSGDNPHAQLDLTQVGEFLSKPALQSPNNANSLQAGPLALRAQALAMLC